MLEEDTIENIKTRLARGEELRDIVGHFGKSCAAIYKLKDKEENLDALDLAGLDPGEPLSSPEDDFISFENL